ncbi:mitochondrial carrier domain-containing protein [Flagelloscypha sp. PMI_526]|nr:mitochondrial carrier domain-containing protein [Flagelloscypha sp. PMI_526]
MLEVLTGLPPFSHVIQESAIIFLVVDGHRPSKPPIEVVSEDAWRLIERCWCQKPSERFTIDEVINTFHKLINIEPSVKLETPGKLVQSSILFLQCYYIGGAQILSHLVGSSNTNYASQKLQTSAKPYLEPPPTETDLVLFTDTPPPYQSRASNSPIADRLIPETSGKYESFLGLVTDLGGELGSLQGKELASLIVPIPRGSVVVQNIHHSDNLPLEPSIYETPTTKFESLEHSDFSESKESGQSWISAYVNDLQNLEIILTFSSFSTAGAGAGKVASMATYPFDVIKTRLQAQRAIPGRAGYQGVYDTISSLAQQSGFRGFYRGLGPTILAYWPTWAIYFSVYDGIKNSFGGSRPGPPYLESRPDVHPLTLHILASMTAGGVSTIFTNPLWVIKTRFMVQRASEVRYKHTLDAATTIYRTEGFAAFYSGLTPNLLGVAHVAIQYPLYQQLKIWTCDNRDEPITSRTILFCSAVSKIPASIVLYPTEVVRTRLQTQKRLLGYENGPRVGLLNFTRTLVRQEGWSSLYRGLSVNIARTLPNSAITMLT